MYSGLPVGYLLLWDNPIPSAGRVFGATNASGRTKAIPSRLVVDGQQRLTSLWATLTGKPIINADFAETTLRISFDPVAETFHVTTKTIRASSRYVHDIGTIVRGQTGPNVAAEELIANHAGLSEADRQRVRTAMGRLATLGRFPLTGLTLSASLTVEQVADVFIRINSKGARLDHGDFILTLMSVYWDEGRRQLEAFCRDAQRTGSAGTSPHNVYIQPRPPQLLTVVASLAFRFARLREIHTAIGNDYRDGVSDQRQQALVSAQSYALDLRNWHDFFAVIRQAGFVDGSMITSKAALLYSYAFFLIGRRDFQMKDAPLGRLMGRWLIMSLLTGKYSAGPNTKMDADLARIRGAKSADDFIAVMEREINAALTDDFWRSTLPNMLEATSTNATAVHVWDASVIARGGTALFGDQRVERTFQSSGGRRTGGVSRVPLFSRTYLKELGFTQAIDLKQVANLAFVDDGTRPKDMTGAPAEYAVRPAGQTRVQWSRQQDAQDLPVDWQILSYEEFLRQRRIQMAAGIREVFDGLDPW